MAKISELDEESRKGSVSICMEYLIIANRACTEAGLV